MRTAFLAAAVLGCLAGVALNVYAGPPCKRYNYLIDAGATEEENRRGMEQVARTQQWACSHPFLYRALLLSVGLVPFLIVTAVGVGVVALVRRAV
ncbi:hypothetical protein B1759_16530 [Rubrivirga sp. SAORIC476]|uniref:hypothetical protein n=1 Tax=Rubrivirga sp. SAORIC476 TaxID=1961794 RepID=UPI000BA98A9B|nr:hypothetical protein [Rubrivirga sp. SAORIC476]PAP74786.1 hypothetical protein B1759_16530 [Rubrivirga sp. SAORIC476]